MYRCIRCIRQLEYQIQVKKIANFFPWFFRIFFFRLKPHSKPITNFALNYPQIYAISQDRKISKTENGVLILKKSIDPSADPILIQILDEFVIVATEAKQIRILNPETLLCRRILSTNGIPKVTCQFKHVFKYVSGFMPIFIFFTGNDSPKHSSNIADDECQRWFIGSQLDNHFDIFQYFFKRLIRCKDFISCIPIFGFWFHYRYLTTVNKVYYFKYFGRYHFTYNRFT